MNQAFIYDAIRTPRGRAKFGGGLSDMTPLQLMDSLFAALVERTGLDNSIVEEVVFGCVSQVGEQGGNIAKASLLFSKWPDHVPGLTINRYCSSGLDAINIASMKVLTGQAKCTIAGGIEMMSRVPMLSDKAMMFSNFEFGLDHRMLMMGSGADLIASLYDISREEADSVAFLSQKRAFEATNQGRFKSIVPIYNPIRDTCVNSDECIREHTSMASLAEMPLAFSDLGKRRVNALQREYHPR